MHYQVTRKVSSHREAHPPHNIIVTDGYTWVVRKQVIDANHHPSFEK